MKKKLLPALIWAIFSCYVMTGYAQITNTKADNTSLPHNTNNFHHIPWPWLTTGNNGTDTAVNFIGTKDAQPLLFKVNNQKAGYIDYSDSHQNTGFGYLTLNANMVSDADHFGVFNSAFGWGALSSNTTGFENAAYGSGSLISNTEGDGNTGIGHFALLSNITGGLSTAVGAYALASNTTGGNNTASGAWALASNATGYSNVANGTPFTLAFNTEGSENTATGAVSMINNTTGNANVAYGSFSLASNITGSNNTALGYAADVTADGLTNATAIGNGALVDASNKVQVGNTGVTSIGGQVGWTNYSDERIKDNVKENVPGLEFIKALRPVTYHFSVAKENALLGIQNNLAKNISMPQLKELKMPNGKIIKLPVTENTANHIKGSQYKNNNEIEKIQFTGFLAQDVDKAATSIGYDFSGIDKSGKIMGLRYSDFVVPLVKAVQELSQQNSELKQRIEKLEEAMKTQSLDKIQRINLSSASLEQNIPNPFNSTSIISYSLPQKYSNAKIIITNTNGKILKELYVSSNKSNVQINASALASGTYNYSLYVDGRLINSKQMILIK